MNIIIGWKVVSRSTSGSDPRHFACVHLRQIRFKVPFFLREALGLEDEVLVQVQDGMKITVVTTTGQDFGEGSEVGLDFALEDLYIFHSESGQTLCCGIGV